MSVPPGSTSAPAPDAASGRDAAWIAYVLHAIGYLTTMIWLSVIGLVVNYMKRSDVPRSFVDSHHGWMIRSFWYGMLWYTLSFAVLLSSAWPVIHAVLRNPTATGEWVLAWSTIFQMAGAAVFGVTGIILTWLWLLYRLIRGCIQLANFRPVP